LEPKIYTKPQKISCPVQARTIKIYKISKKYEEHCRASSPKTNDIMSTATGEHILPPTGKGHP
jgi:hypothetical protein